MAIVNIYSINTLYYFSLEVFPGFTFSIPYSGIWNSSKAIASLTPYSAGVTSEFYYPFQHLTPEIFRIIIDYTTKGIYKALLPAASMPAITGVSR
jgi:hypothetical protein